MTQQQVQRTHFGQVGPKWHGLGRLLNEQFFVGSSYKKYRPVATGALLAV